jgi:NTE family protein
MQHPSPAIPTLDGISAMEALWRRLRRTILPLSWSGLLGLLRWRDHLVRSDGLRRLLELHLPYRNLEDAALPLHVVTTDILSGEAVVLSRGPATQAILANSAIPGAFAPVHIDGRPLCDGAIASNTPMQVAVACGARRLVVLPTGAGPGPRHPSTGAIATGLHATTLLTAHPLVIELDRLGETIECHVLPNACPLRVLPSDFSRTSELMERGYRGTLHWIREGGMNCSVMRSAKRSQRRSARRAPTDSSWTACAPLPARRYLERIDARQQPYWRARRKQADPSDVASIGWRAEGRELIAMQRSRAGRLLPISEQV